MSLDELRRDDHGDSLVVLGRDLDGRIRGFLHFAPSYGRAAVSLSLMRREQETPNGLMEFLVARGIGLLRDRGVEEVSLNFATFARFVHAPRGRLERLAGRGLLVADSYFQLERLHRFNSKFFPRWEPRYLMYERVAGLPRVGLAALWVEGQVPKPAPSRVTTTVAAPGRAGRRIRRFTIIPYSPCSALNAPLKAATTRGKIA